MLHAVDPFAVLDLLGSVLATAPLDEVPEDDEVKAGWTALLIWLGMALVTAFLSFSLVKRLRNTRAHFDGVDAAEAERDAGQDPEGR
ncbi:MAG: hypothetical protein Q8Q02_01670 [Nocardioides sp.]|nr:hypothetical protein [Nocardioides sp.]